MVRVMIERRCRADKAAEAESLLMELRAGAMQQRGYVSGETLRAVDDPSLWLVISTWLDANTWKAWQKKAERRALSDKLAGLLLAPEKITLFTFVRRGAATSTPATIK